jgi:hypothetical protein
LGIFHKDLGIPGRIGVGSGHYEAIPEEYTEKPKEILRHRFPVIPQGSKCRPEGPNKEEKRIDIAPLLVVIYNVISWL